MFINNQQASLTYDPTNFWQPSVKVNSYMSLKVKITGAVMASLSKILLTTSSYPNINLIKFSGASTENRRGRMFISSKI